MKSKAGISGCPSYRRLNPFNGIRFYRNLMQTKRTSIVKTAWGWLRFAIVIGAILYLFAPPSWWQFGVTKAVDREQVSGFTLSGFDGGNQWDFADKRGKVVLVNYWATWCGPCRFETPGLVNISNRFESRDFEIVGVTVDNDLASVPEFIESYGIGYPVLLPGNDPNITGEAMTLPTTFLYDKQGRLAKKYTGIVLEMTLRSDIESLLAE